MRSRIYLVCANCQAEFLASESQSKHARAAGGSSKQFGCSEACRRVIISKGKIKPIPVHGPCPTCGKMFQSRTSKQYCGMGCYTASPEFKARIAAAAKKGNRAGLIARGIEPKDGKTVNCLQCGVEFYQQPASKKKYCSQLCYRKYMAARFDRWIASPQTIALPQAYDEFLIEDELPCLVEGCGWRGQALSAHMNFAHGVPAAEFKRAAGFNIGTGVVGAAMHQALVDRPHIHLAIGLVPNAKGNTPPRPIMNYISRESREHFAKTRALMMGQPEAHPLRVCMACGKEFRQSTPFGYTQYCTIKCRDDLYRARKTDKCLHCGAAFQQGPTGNKKFCSPECYRAERFGKLAGITSDVPGRFEPVWQVHAHLATEYPPSP